MPPASGCSAGSDSDAALCELPAITKEEFWERASQEQEIFPTENDLVRAEMPEWCPGSAIGGR